MKQIEKIKLRDKKGDSTMGKIGQKIRAITDDNDVRKFWEDKKGKLKLNVYHSTKVSDKEFDEIRECFKQMKESTKYSEYKKWFDKMCKMCNIPNENCIIRKFRFNKGKDDKNEVFISYANTEQKITIPHGSGLYHMSTIDNLTELNPFFQGKAARGYLYSEPRVYVTIRKNMSNICADLKPGTKKTWYKVKENIRSAYVDPLLPMYFQGAVYIKTKFPIPVEKIDMKKEKAVKESMINDFEFDEPVFTSLEEFVEYYGLEIVDDEVDVIEESFAAKMGSIERKMNDNNFIKNTWNKLTSKIQNSTIEKDLTEAEYNKVKKDFDVLKTSHDYKTYKKSYENICKFFSLKPEETTIRLLRFVDSKTKYKKIEMVVHVGKMKIMIPNDVILIHTSTNGDIKELKPNFCSKKRGFYMWPTRRVYFTLGKPIAPKKVGAAGSQTHRYTPKEKIRTAYIDSELPSFNSKCIFIDTQFPIPVKKIEDDNKGVVKKLQDVIK